MLHRNYIKITTTKNSYSELISEALSSIALKTYLHRLVKRSVSDVDINAWNLLKFGSVYVETGKYSFLRELYTGHIKRKWNSSSTAPILTCTTYIQRARNDNRGKFMIKKTPMTHRSISITSPHFPSPYPSYTRLTWKEVLVHAKVTT